MNLLMSLYLVALFVAFTPGVLIPPGGGSKLTVAVVHGVLLSAVWYFTHKAVWKMTSGMQGFQNAMPAKPAKPANK